MSEWTVDRAASVLLEAEAAGTGRPPITDEWPGLDLATAYAVQDETLRRRQARGERLVGVKLGLTSRAKQQRMNIGSPLTAWLTDAMVLPAGAPVPRERLIHPRAERLGHSGYPGVAGSMSGCPRFAATTGKASRGG